MLETKESCRWLGRLDLQVVATAFGSRLAERSHVGPLRIQRPFFPEGADVPHLYLLHPPGGVVGGDSLELNLRVEEAANALVTTPAAQKLYRSGGARGELTNRLVVENGASLEYLPAETIVFEGAQVLMRTQIILQKTCNFMGWDVICLGRPAGHHPFSTGTLTIELECNCAGERLLLERMCITGGSPLLDAPWGFGGHPVLGTMLWYTGQRDLACAVTDSVRRALERWSPLFGAVTCMGNLVVLRVLSPSVEQTHLATRELWSLTRPMLLGRQACAPRVWAT